MKRALDALRDFRIDVEEGEVTERTLQPVHLDKSRPRPQPQTIRLAKVQLKTGDVSTAAEVNVENPEHISEGAIRRMAVAHVEAWLKEKLGPDKVSLGRVEDEGVAHG